jgi:anti-sigma regulatory factor (Ser/Thr protein kinase)
MNRLAEIRRILQKKIARRARKSNVRVVLLYGAVASMWMIVSDLLLHSFSPTGVMAYVVITGQGLLFVSLTAAILFGILQRHTALMTAAEGELHEQENRIRQAYVEVLSAVTGGRLVLVSQEELEMSLGTALGTEHEVSDPAQLNDARQIVRQSTWFKTKSADISMELLSPVSEALNNALKHGGAARFQVYAYDNTIQVRVEDDGPGIDFCNLPSATLVSGYSTTATLGLGFTIILQMCERVLLATRPGRTTILLEFTAAQGQQACQSPNAREDESTAAVTAASLRPLAPSR